jgi:membrane protein required for colicin V production
MLGLFGTFILFPWAFQTGMGAAFALSFLGALVVWALLSRLVRLLIHATPLSLPDRLLGAVFGLLRGLVLLLALATVVALTPASQSPGWRASQGARWLGVALATLKPLLPQPVARLVRT